MAVQIPSTPLEQFKQFVDLPENAGRLFELINGRIVEKVGSFTPSQIALWIGTFINMYLLKNPIGWATGADGTYILSDDYAPIPDVGYISKARLTNAPDREVPMPPDLAVEVKSPNDTYKSMRDKAHDYLSHGTKVVWLVYPEKRQIEVMTADDFEVLRVGDTLDGGDVLPDFKLAIADVFR